MTIALVAHTGIGYTGSTATTTTSSIDTTGATLLVVGTASSPSQGNVTVSDSKSNTWTGLTVQTNATAGRLRLWYAANPTVGSGHTFTAALNLSFPALCVVALSGAVTASPADQQNGAIGASGTTAQAGSVTPTENNEVLVACLSLGVVRTPSIDSSFTIQDHIAFSSSQNFGIDLATFIQGTAGALNPQWSWTTNTVPASVIATFKATPASVSFARLERGIRGLNRGLVVGGW